MMDISDESKLGIPVPLGKIEQRLRDLWEADEASSKASLINFAVYSESRGALEANQQSIRTITEEQACRVILIELDRNAETTKSEAWISAHCQLISGQKAICSEQIAFRLSGRETGRLRNVVFSHLESDLPLVFWWQGNLSDRFQERLYSLIDRLISDSSTWDDPLQGFLKIQQANAWLDGGLVVQDLEWTRSFYHRLALAALFDEPTSEEILDGLNQVEILVHPEHRIAGLMVVAWLMSRAGWKMASDRELVQDSRAPHSWLMACPSGREFEVNLNFDKSFQGVGSIILKSERLEASVADMRDGAHLKMHLGNDDVEFESLHPSGPEKAPDLVAAQLSRGGKNALFRAMLPRLVELLNLEQSTQRISSR